MSHQSSFVGIFSLLMYKSQKKPLNRMCLINKNSDKTSLKNFNFAQKSIYDSSKVNCALYFPV